ncbi:hypothetical protein A2U01_0096259, partial [Trifolium medium]|nr:hypothetical protein [Trifolium medium]
IPAPEGQPEQQTTAAPEAIRSGLRSSDFGCPQIFDVC